LDENYHFSEKLHFISKKVYTIYFTNLNSTLLFFALPASELLGITGRDSPYPIEINKFSVTP
jgi:hypothetical protein